MAEKAKELIILCDINLRIIYINPAAISSSGFKENEILGSSIEGYLDSNYLLKVRELIENNFENSDSLDLCQTVFHRKDNRSIQVEVNFEPIIKQKTTQGYLFLARDISKRICMEEDILRAQKLESIGVLAGGIAHDYNNLLTALMGYMTLAESYLNPDNKALGLLGRARHAAILARNLSRKLITFAKGGKTHQQARLHSADPGRHSIFCSDGV